MIAVSGCLVGLCCRYDGKAVKNEAVMAYLKDKTFITVCPEQMGGLSTPRLPAEIMSLEPLCIKNNEGLDVTKEFSKGVDEVMKLVDLQGVTEAVLKSKSPSCGKYYRYDGTFTRTVVEDSGILAKAMMKRCILVFNEEDIEEKMNKIIKG